MTQPLDEPEDAEQLPPEPRSAKVRRFLLAGVLAMLLSAALVLLVVLAGTGLTALLG
ncbi:MAG: hypothetical protein AAF607_17640 [Pseudomonadota bacterium]